MQTKLLSRVWGEDTSGKDPRLDGDTRRIILLRGTQRMVIYEGDDGALDWDDNCLGRGQARKDNLNDMWDSYAASCDANGEDFYGWQVSGNLLRTKITTR